MESPVFWDNPSKAQKISQEASILESFLKNWELIKSSIEDFKELLEIASESEVRELSLEIETLQKKFNEQETLCLFSGEYDMGNALLSIHVGNGGQDAEDFCQILLRMYLRFAEKKGFKANLLEESPSESGLKSALIEIKGAFAYGFLKSEHGIHRLIRLSPFNAKNLRQTSFAKIEVLPEIDQDIEINLDPSDLRIDVFRSSGAGGQSVNTTDSAVRITYLPLNLVVTCQNEKSQLQNKAAALKVLKSRLIQLKIEQKAEEINEIRGEKMEANFGSQIRTYTLQPYQLVKDHRTSYEEGSPDRVFDGDLDGFMQNYLQNQAL